jgi:tetratricopeptide (TPR) repeat protein/cold shock CspA family protein
MTADSRQALAEAAAAAERKEWERAADLLANAGDSTEVLDKRSFYFSRSKRYDEALELFAILREREPENFLWHYMTGYQCAIQERFAESLPFFREALRLNDGHVKSWWRAANALARTGDERKAVICAGRVLKLWHSLPEEAKDQDRSSVGKASYLLGKIQMRSDPHGAIPLLEQALEADPQDPHRNYRLGKALRYANRPAEALPYLRRAAKLKPGDTNIEVELAIVLGRTGEKGEAEALLRRVERRLRGWDLLKGGQLALDLERPHLALRLLDRAERDRTTRGNDRLEDLLARARDEARTAPPEKGDRAGGRPRRQRDGHAGGAAETGRVAVVNEERNFGFLLDDSGTRRHFRPSGMKVHRGQRVRFTPLDAEKGPAARDLQPL